MVRFSDAVVFAVRRVPSLGTAALAGAVIFSTLGPAGAMTNMTDALSLCSNTGLNLEERADAFSTAGWVESTEASEIVNALAAGIFISNVEAGAPETWDAEFSKSVQVASNLRSRRGIDGLRFLGSPDMLATITLEPNSSGLETCLFTGGAADISGAADIIGTQILVVGPRASVRGDIAGGLLVAHSFDPAQGAFDPPLRFKSTFTIVLDRKQRD